ncbi:MAG TPA: prolipoprotein diacylglyceryl transferase [Chloroflexota bacterium]|jgi:phosphatidylglycerol:prolipoprotein diacylglycerol transferase|nr:prolipoprotein diacylglyceryl transferase [Chloroflexota bacterium]
MIILPFDPVALRLGPLILTWHGIFTAVGILAGLQLAARLAPAARVATEAVWNATWWVVIGGLVGARLLFVLEHPQLFVDAPWRILLINEGGISVFGAVLGGAAATALWARQARVSPARLLDAVAPGFLLGQAIGRIGDIINGEHLGAHAPGLPWAVIYTHPDTLGEIGVPVHPAVAYELLWDLLAAGCLIWLLLRFQTPRPAQDPAPPDAPRAARRRLPGGVVFWTGLLLYGLGRLWTGFYRLDAPVAMGLGLAQLIGLLSIPLSLAGILLARWRRGRLHAASAPA